ncbi:MAG: glycine C-acetyltransferase [Deltaproteobacteria bacterium]|nr:glycine C-acetyltransferase [Deltaproteobacteria bacterium]
MYGKMKDWLQTELASIKEQGLYKSERIIMGPQSADIKVKTGEDVVNFCANNYLGLSSHPKVVKAAHEGLDKWGYGMSSVRFICGTQDIHKVLEEKVSKFLGTEDTILYSSAFDANGGVFEPLLDKDCAIITDQLNHASIIDGIRLCKATRLIYQHADMADLEAKLRETQGAKYRLISSDGAFSMDGDIAKLDQIVALAEKYDALVQVDDAHATGFLGKHGRGSHEHNNVVGKIDIITGTFGKALGGASGGFTSGRKEIVELLRQRSRPYLFSNTVSSAVVYATIAVFDLLSETTELRDKLEWNTKYFRDGMTKAGFEIKPGVHPICPIMLYDAPLAQKFAAQLLAEGIYVIGFFYPVVPKGQARIRVQLSAGHEKKHLDKAIAAFTKVGKGLGVLKQS